MPRKKSMLNVFKPIKSPRHGNVQGKAGYDNPRENIDPFIKTQVINTKQFSGNLIFTGGGMCHGGISAQDNSTETAIAVAGTPVQVTIFDTNAGSNNTIPDHTEDHIEIQKAGFYYIGVSATVNSVSGAGSRFEITVSKNNNGTPKIIPHADRNISGGGGQSGVIAMVGCALLEVGDTVEVWIENETNTQNYIIENIGITLFQIGA